MDVLKGFTDRTANLSSILLAVGAGVVILRLLHTHSRLSHIPGPASAALTDFVRRSWVAAGDVHQKHTDLHRRYGTVVRVGPNAVLISQPDAVDKIYGFKAKFLKVRSCLPLQRL